MKILARHIEYLAMWHDCVVVPGFGAFLAHDCQARLDGEVFCAPCRTLTFNPDIKADDGLLVTSIARQKGIDIAEARQLIDSEVAKLTALLDSNGHASLGNLGFLLKSGHDAPVRFTPSAENALNFQAEWFPKIDVSAYAKVEVPKHKVAEIKVDTFRHHLSGLARYATAAVVLVIIGFAASTPTAVHEASLASLAIQPKVSETPEQVENFVYTPSKACPTIVLNYDRQTETDTVAEQPAVETTIEKATKKPVSVDVRMIDSDSFCVIIASLNSAEDAADFVTAAARKGQTYGVLEQNGRYRIYAATAPSHAQAQSTLNALVLKHKGAWICQR